MSGDPITNVFGGCSPCSDTRATLLRKMREDGISPNVGLQLKEELDDMKEEAKDWQERCDAVLMPAVRMAAEAAGKSGASSLFQQTKRKEPKVGREDEVVGKAVAPKRGRKRPHDEMEEEDDTGDIVFRLPSAVADVLRKEPAMAQSRAVELELRKSQGRDLLNELREVILTKFALEHQGLHKRTQAGVIVTTRSWKKITKKSVEIKGVTEAYRQCRRTMLALGLSSDDDTFKDLKENDIRPLEIGFEQSKDWDESEEVVGGRAKKRGKKAKGRDVQSQSHKRTSWIWGELELLREDEKGRPLSKSLKEYAVDGEHLTNLTCPVQF